MRHQSRSPLESWKANPSCWFQGRNSLQFRTRSQISAIAPRLSATSSSTRIDNTSAPWGFGPPFNRYAFSAARNASFCPERGGLSLLLMRLFGCWLHFDQGSCYLRVPDSLLLAKVVPSFRRVHRGRPLEACGRGLMPVQPSWQSERSRWRSSITIPWLDNFAFASRTCAPFQLALRNSRGHSTVIKT
jgi:hypothetical protein